MRSAALLGLLVMVSAAFAVKESLSEMQSRFDRETRGVPKAKLIAKLGDMQFEAARTAERAGDYSSIALIMEKYRDNVKAATDALKKEHADPERHSNGYRQLEMHVRKGIREVDEILIVVPEPYKPPVQLVRQDLISVDDELLRMLFPRRQDEGKAAPQPSGAQS
jgi:hypothetical protein